MPMLVAANFDRWANDHPERLDLERRPNRHVAFGAGIHFGLGHPACAHRRQVRVAGPVRALAEARAGDGGLESSLAHPNRHPCARALAVTAGPVALARKITTARQASAVEAIRNGCCCPSEEAVRR